MSIVVPPGTLHYADLNIRHTGDPQKTLALVKRAIRMGYDAIAINIDIGDFSTGEEPEDFELNNDNPPPNKKKKRQKGSLKAAVERTIPDPFLLDTTLLDTTLLEQQGKKLRLFSRITFTLSDQTIVHNIFMSPQLKKFDIVAVRPSDEAMLSILSRKTDAIDLICFDASVSYAPNWMNKRKLMEQIQNEGIGFEFTYAPALISREQRRSVLSSGRRLVRGLRCRGLVFCSAAENILELRAPVDVMNMLSLWGVDGASARPMISLFAQQVLHRAEARRTVKGVLHAVNIEQGQDSEIKALVPGKMDSKLALKRLLTVKEFRAQIEFIAKEET